MSSKTRNSTRQRTAKPRKSTKNTKRKTATKGADPVQLAEVLAGKDVVRQHHVAGVAVAAQSLEYEYPGILVFLGALSTPMLDMLEVLDLMACFDITVQAVQPFPRHRCRDFWPQLWKSWLAQKTVAGVARQLVAGELILPGVPKTRLRSLRGAA